MLIKLVEYIQRIDFSGVVKANIETLKSLHSQQLFYIPFENFDVINKQKIILDIDHLENKIKR